MAEHQTEPSQDMNVGVIVVIALVSVLLLVIAIIGTQAWYQFEYRQERWRKVVNQSNPALVKYEQSERNLLRGGARPEAGQAAAMDIERAMKLYVQQQGGSVSARGGSPRTSRPKGSPPRESSP